MRFETENPWIVGPVILVGIIILVAAAYVGVMRDWNAYLLGMSSGFLFGVIKVRRL